MIPDEEVLHHPPCRRRTRKGASLQEAFCVSTGTGWGPEREGGGGGGGGGGKGRVWKGRRGSNRGQGGREEGRIGGQQRPVASARGDGVAAPVGWRSRKSWLSKNRGTDYIDNHRTLSSNRERPGRHPVECNQLAVFAYALQRVCVREAHVMGKGRPKQCTCERTRATRPRRPAIFRHAVGRFENMPSLAFTAPFSRGTLRGVVPTRDFRQKSRDIAGIFLVGLKSIPLS